MRTRVDLHHDLVNVLKSKYVYFQPPESIKLVFPCIIYGLNRVKNDPADDETYRRFKQYKVTLITTDPDSGLFDDILNLPMCSFDRSYTADGLYHFVFLIYN